MKPSASTGLVWSFALCVLSAASSLAKSVSPPNTLSLIYPNPNTSVNLGEQVQLGLATDYDKEYYGLLNNVSVSVLFPNGTTLLLITASSGLGNCQTYSDGYTGSVIADSVGSWTASWNVTYGISTTVPSKANSTFCGPEPFSYQSWVLNQTFTVEHLGQGVQDGVITTSTKLPTRPTGHVYTSGARATLHMMAGTIVTMNCLWIFAALASWM